MGQKWRLAESHILTPVNEHQDQHHDMENQPFKDHLLGTAGVFSILFCLFIGGYARPEPPILPHVATRTWQAPSLQSTRSNTRALQPPLGWGYVLLGVAKSHENMYMCILGGFLSHGGSPVVTMAFNTHMVIHDLDDLGVTP